MRNQKTNYSNPYNASTFVFSIIFLIFCERGFSQNSFPSSGNVGIGTTNPLHKLHVRSGDLGLDGNLKIGIKRRTSQGVYLFRDGAASPIGVNSWGLEFKDDFDNGNHLLSLKAKGNLELNLNKYGNVGIGTVNPISKLDVEGGDFHLGKEVSSNGQRRLLRIYGFDNGSQFSGSIQSNWENARRTFDIYTSSSTNQIKIDASANPDGRIVMFPGDNVGVGIGTLAMGTHKLAVEGSIGAREVKVQANGWSDFVFEKDYELPTLEEVANHIAQKGHLKDIPSAAEVEKEGIFLGEMDSKLLQKIEELTLYILEQDKVNKKQAVIIDKLEKRISKIENQ